MPPKDISPLSKARNYCARQERCQQEVRDKLYAWGSHKDEVEATVSQLISEGFLNEARFADHYAVSKSRQKGWGRRKIEQAMRMKGVSEPCIALGLKAIDGDEEEQELKKAVLRRFERSKEVDPYVKRQKVSRYFIGKGHSADSVQAAMTAVEDRHSP